MTLLSCKDKMPLTMIRNLSGNIYKGMTKSKSQISPKYA